MTHYTHEWVTVKKTNVMSAKDPVACSLTPQKPGSHRITAAIKDTRDREHASRIYQWVVGKGEVVWNKARITVWKSFPKRIAMHPVEKARYLVQKPFSRSPGTRHG